MTLLLGMKPNEHEFKVMGLAPYGKSKYSMDIINIFKKTLYVDGINFKYKTKPSDNYFWFQKKFEGYRFDNIAFALQKYTEELLVTWITNSINKFKINNIIISGGVAMNIKAMGEISKINKVKKMFVAGSGSDESLAIGSGLVLYEEILKKNKMKFDNKKLKVYITFT